MAISPVTGHGFQNTKILLKWISAPEARDSTKACRFLPPVFSRGRTKGQDSMTSTSLVTPCVENKIVTNIQRLTKTKYEIPQNRLLGSG